MPERIEIRVNGQPILAEAGTSVAAALANAGISGFRRSRSGEPRGPVCGMGVCLECRVRVDGVEHQRACQIVCRPGMEISYGD